MGSTRPNILIAMPVDTGGLARISEMVPEGIVDCIDWIEPDTDLPPELIRERTILFTDLPPRNLAEMARLEWIQLGSAGYMQLVGLPLRSMGVRVTNASGVNDVPIAEWCLMMMLLFERDLPGLLRAQAERRWARDLGFQAELRGKRVGIIGYGNIGRETARACRALGLEVWAMNRSPITARPLRYAPPGTGDPDGALPHRAFDLSQMGHFLPHLDFLILSAALNPATRGLLADRELRLLPRSAVILNPARAQLIDEAALRRALEEGWIAGAALDAHYREPLQAGDPIWEVPNMVLTSHISGSDGSPYYISRLWELLTINIQRYLRDEPLLNEVTWADLDAR